MKLSIEINETLWSYELVKFNAAEAARVATVNDDASKRHAAIQAQTPPNRQVPFVPLAEPSPFSLPDYVAKIIGDKEATITSARNAEHDAAILAATPEDKARIAKILAQPDQTKDAIREQIDAL